MYIAVFYLEIWFWGETGMAGGAGRGGGVGGVCEGGKGVSIKD